MNIFSRHGIKKQRSDSWFVILLIIILNFAGLMLAYSNNMQDPDYSSREHTWMLPYWFLFLSCGMWISATYYRSIGYLALGLVALVQAVASFSHPNPLASILGFALGGLLWFGIGHLIGRLYRHVG